MGYKDDLVKRKDGSYVLSSKTIKGKNFTYISQYLDNKDLSLF